jgi:hypothetical protein
VMAHCKYVIFTLLREASSANDFKFTIGMS